MPKKSWKNLFDTNHIVQAVGIVIAVSLIWQTVKVVQKNYALQGQVDHLEDEIAILELRNKRLEYDIQYYQTDEYLELAARDKFNKKASGEKVVILRDSGFENSDEEAETQEYSTNKPLYQENLDQWLYFLFKREPS